MYWTLTPTTFELKHVLPAVVAALAIGLMGGCEHDEPSVGAPGKIGVEGEYRHLRFKVSGGTMIVMLKNNLVTEIVQRD